MPNVFFTLCSPPLFHLAKTRGKYVDTKRKLNKGEFKYILIQTWNIIIRKQNNTKFHRTFKT